MVRCIDSQLPWTFVYHGLNYPNHYHISQTWERVCERDRALAKWHLLIWQWIGIESLDLHANFPYDILQDILARHAVDNVAIIIDSQPDAPDYATYIEPICRSLNHDYGIPLHNIMHWTAHDEHADITMLNSGYGPAIGYRHIWHRDDFWETHDRRFIMLARRSRALRQLAATEILDQGLEHQGYISCGALDNHNDDHFDLVPEHHRHRFPMRLEAPMTEIDFTNQYLVTDPRICDSPIHLICESSQDAVFPMRWLQWTVPWLTEKTTKAMLLCQLPIWIGVSGQVEAARRFGLDVFDDHIDHGYDEIDDPRSRVRLAVAELARLCAMTDGEIDQLRQRLWPRLKRNQLHVVNHVKNLPQYMDAQLTSWYGELTCHA